MNERDREREIGCDYFHVMLLHFRMTNMSVLNCVQQMKRIYLSAYLKMHANSVNFLCILSFCQLTNLSNGNALLYTRMWHSVMYVIVRSALRGFGGLEIACWPLVPKYAGSNPAEAVGFCRAKKFLPSEGK